MLSLFLGATLWAQIALFTQSEQDTPTRIDWKENRLTLLSPRLPNGKTEVWYLEAFCRPGSTKREWEQSVIPHKTTRLDGEGAKGSLRLRTEVEGGVVLTHTIRVTKDGVRFDIHAENRGSQKAEVDWAQPCMQVADFTGRTQETYIERTFIFTNRKERQGLTLLSELPRNEEARYRGGQVFVPKEVNRDDVNPRPLSDTIPANGLIGCFSADDKSILAMAWSDTQELFQGVIVCIHSDFRIGGLNSGEKKHLWGKIYLVPNDIPALLRRYRRDFGRR